MAAVKEKFLGCLALILAILLPVPVVHADEESICNRPVIDRVFADYEQKVKRSQILRIQNLLRDGGYDPGAIDGYTGIDTDSALERLCFDFGVDTYLGPEAAAVPEADSDPAQDTEAPEEGSEAPPPPPPPPAELALLLVKLLESSAPVSAEHPGWMPLLRGEMFAAWLQQEPPINLLEMLETAPDEWAGQVLGLIENFPGRKPPPNDELPEIMLSGGGCGCSHDFIGQVYGFYPHWLANGKEQLVDFSLLDRIGFFALKLNREGEVADPLYWQNFTKDEPGIAGFVHKAHKHRVAVDVVFYASEWQTWEDDAVDEAARNMVAMLQRKFTNLHSHWLRKTLPLVEDTSAVGADGITLYFDRYRAGDDKALLHVVETLAREMDQAGTRSELNVMLGRDLVPSSESVVDDALIRGLAELLAEDENRKPRLSKVLVFLNEPTTDSKKRLRQRVENALHGHQRKTLLRHIVPIVMATDERVEAEQFDDDLIYFQDNFAGVGLWPLALDQSGEPMKKKLLRHYQVVNDDANYLGELLERNFPSVCEFVCPNRWMFRAAFTLLLALLLAYVVLVLWNCRLREIYQKNFVYFIAVGIAGLLIYVISLVCDPVWEERADSVVIVILLLIVGGFLWRYLRKLMQPPLP